MERRLFNKIRNKIVNEIDIKSIVDRYINVQKKSGNTYFYYTPFKNERTPSFAVSPTKKIFKCFSTGVGGDVIKFVSLMEKISYEQALIKLAKEFFPELLKDYIKENNDYSYHINLMHKLSDIFHKNFMKSDIAKDYLFSRRKLSETVYKDFFIGYVDTYQFIKNFNKEEMEYLSNCGILYRKDNTYYSSVYNALSLPYYDSNGNIVYISFRFIKNPNLRYKNMKIVEAIKDLDIYYFGYYQSKYKIVKEKMVVICEGAFDAMTMYDAGVPSFATGGVSSSLKYKYLDNSVIIYLAFDNDAAGYNFTVKTGIDLIKRGYYVKVLDFGPFKDLNESIQSLKYDINKVKKNGVEFIDYYYRKSIKNFSKEKDYVYLKSALGDKSTINKCAEQYVSFMIECYDNLYTGNEVRYDILFKHYLDSLDCKTQYTEKDKDFNHVFVETVYNMIDIVKNNDDIKNTVLSILVLLEPNEVLVDLYDYLTGSLNSLPHSKFAKYYNHEIENKAREYNVTDIKNNFVNLFNHYYESREYSLLKEIAE